MHCIIAQDDVFGGWREGESIFFHRRGLVPVAKDERKRRSRNLQTPTSIDAEGKFTFMEDEGRTVIILYSVD